MRRAPRLSIAGLMVVTLVISLALAALSTASATWAGGVYLMTNGVLCLALVGAGCRGPSERAWWLGFALFGLGYLRLLSPYGYSRPRLPTTALLDVLRPSGLRAYGQNLMYGGPEDHPLGYYWVVGHCLWTLAAAAAGGWLSQVLFAPLPTARLTALSHPYGRAVAHGRNGAGLPHLGRPVLSRSRPWSLSVCSRTRHSGPVRYTC